MFKLYKKMKPFDWVMVIVIVGLTVLQVYCTMLLVDYTRDIIQFITFLDYHNNPSKLGELGAMILPDWSNAEIIAATLPEEGAEMLRAVAKATTGDIWFNGGMMLVVALGSALTQSLIGLLAADVSARLTTNIRSDFYKKVDEFSVAEVNKFSTPSLITRATNDVQQVQVANVMMLRMIIAAPITAIWALCKIQATSTILTVATAVGVVVMVIAITSIVLAVMKKFKIMQKLTDRLNGVARENLTGLRVVRAYNAENYQEAKFEKANDDITKTQLFTGRVMALMSPVMMLIMNGITLAIYWIGASLINGGTTDYATVTSFMMLSSQIIMAFMMLIMMFVLLPRAQVSATRINEVLNTEISVKDPEVEKELKEKGTVEFKNVAFAYPDSDEPVISNISFKANKGETVAFIGSTGSGKSTLINLVPRFYDVTEGEILIDGVNVKDIKHKTLSHIIGYVPQKGVLFSGTVKDNIAFGNPDITDDEMINAAKTAEADGFISEMEQGYDSPISQGGKNVSGGQKQRISIARAVAMNPEIFIFDDSFSALDYKTDKKVRENLKENFKDATKLIVAQRIGTIMDADKILVLDSGEAVGVGTHKELLKNCDIYREIALSQLSKEELGL